LNINESKYHNLFINKFKSDTTQFSLAFAKAIQENGNTDDAKIKFYKKEFDWVMIKLKRQFSKDENYEYIITATYTLFTTALKEDNIDSSKVESDLNIFKTRELPKIKPVIKNLCPSYVPENRNYNLNTRYGRRKAREQAQRNYDNGSPEYKSDIDNIKTVFWLIVIALVMLGFFIKIMMK
jgi:hypothetical protein